MRKFITPRTWQFPYFDTQLDSPDWTGKRVLDFGGNAGNFLRFPDVPTRPEDYWCIDIMTEALDEGRRLHPDARFIHYDRYNFEYNRTGVVGLPIPDPGVRFDFVISCGVFPHMSQADMVEAVARLRTFLAPDGLFAFTFLDPHWVAPPGWTPPEIAEDDGVSRTNLRYFLEVHGYAKYLHRAESGLRPDLSGVFARAEAAELTYLVVVNDGELFLGPDTPELPAERANHRYLAFCTEQHMRQLFPDARVRPPVPPERLHCAIVAAGR